MQLNVMVVDDELIHLNSLSNMIVKLHPEYRVMKAKNGKDALDMLVANKVDLLLTDIQMPIMDGLELIEKALNCKKDIKIIILSGHREFEYAKKAISYGVDDYLVKPLSKQKVNEMLEKVEESFTEEHMKSQKNEAMRNQLNTALPVYFEHQMNKWIVGELSGEERAKIESIFIEGDPYLIAIVKVQDMKEHSKKHKALEQKHQIRYHLKKAFECVGHSVSFELYEQEGMFVNVVRLNCLDRLDEDIKMLLPNMLKELKVCFFDMHISVSDVINPISSGVKEGFIHAMETLKYRYYLTEPTLLTYKSIVINPSANVDLHDVEKQIQEGLKSYNTTQVKRAIYKSHQNIMEHQHKIQPEKVRLQLMTLHTKLLEMIRLRLRDDVFKRYYDEVEVCIMNQEFLKVCIQQLDRIYMNLIETLWEGKTDELTVRMVKCINYIQKHYDRDLPLEEVADLVYYSSSQFSCCFKKYTGKTFKQYLLALRMEKACTRLEMTEDKVFIIAKKTGFNDHKYFHRVFKNNFGVTPDEYRRNRKNNKYSHKNEVYL